MREKIKSCSCLKLWNYDSLTFNGIMDTFGIYNINELEQLALELYHSQEKEKIPIELLTQIIDDILYVRAEKLDNNHIWTDENVKELVRVSDLFVLATEKACAYEELITKELEMKKNRDYFLLDYEIEKRLIPYLRGYEKNESGSDCFMYVLCEPLENRNNVLFTYNIDRYCDKTANYNYTMLLCDDKNQPLDCFKDKFISYAIYELKDTMIWSYYDIMNINRISIDVKVNYQSFLGEYS